jgi:hypothetical protein
LRGVDVREDEVEDVAVPGDGLAFDAGFDVLLMKRLASCLSFVGSNGKN